MHILFALTKDNASETITLMTYWILLAIGLVTLWACLKTAEEVHRLALASTSFLALGWGYIMSPSLVQWLSAIFVLGVYQIYASTIKC